MTRQRLDQTMVERGLVPSRSQAESYIKLGEVQVNGKPAGKSGLLVSSEDKISLMARELYVSRAGLKLASVARPLGISFQDKIVLDVGSSTGGFTDYALRHGAKKVIAVDVGSQQLHQSLRNDSRIELHEKTDIRDFITDTEPDIILADVSFISLREVLPAIAALSSKKTQIAVMVKPQFEAGSIRKAQERHRSLKHRGVIKNDKMRRDILKDFEQWAAKSFIVLAKADSEVSGAKGNQERFYLLRKA